MAGPGAGRVGHAVVLERLGAGRVVPGRPGPGVARMLRPCEGLGLVSPAELASRLAHSAWWDKKMVGKDCCIAALGVYYAITKPLEYGVKRTPRRMVGCVSLVWLMAACISLPPLLILGNEHEPPDGKGPPQCTVCQNFGYQVSKCHSRTGRQQDASRTPAGRQQDASRTPVGRQQDASRRPAGRQQDASKTPARRQQDASKTPAGRQQDASRTPAGRQQDASKTPARRQQDASRTPIYATLWSFYIPLTVMIVVYYKIFRAARRIVLEERRAQTHLGPPHGYLQPPALPYAGACCSYHHTNHHGGAAPAADRADRAAAGGGAGGGGGGGAGAAGAGAGAGGEAGAGVKNGGTSPDVMTHNSLASSLLLTTPTGANSSSAAPNASPGSSPAASTPAASGRQHRPSTTSTNTTNTIPGPTSLCCAPLGSSSPSPAPPPLLARQKLCQKTVINHS
ncbi:5-hydroxytryptamine receptor 1 [Frankliniella fusca]|uniref:5-hydroxytryptamine receptor 1 n=1 Tax=Frankliniella fusca TaxID=407009 RepID=A0AAE1HIR5_9NEOP|nr:5-hydroxytryptamine receptor 1 [Frankliniella fusca]